MQHKIKPLYLCKEIHPWLLDQTPPISNPKFILAYTYWTRIIIKILSLLASKLIYIYFETKHNHSTNFLFMLLFAYNCLVFYLTVTEIACCYSWKIKNRAMKKITLLVDLRRWLFDQEKKLQITTWFNWIYPN